MNLRALMQVEGLESELSAARKSAAGHATEMSDLSKRLSDAMGRTAKLDDKVGLHHILCSLKAWQIWKLDRLRQMARESVPSPDCQSVSGRASDLKCRGCLVSLLVWCAGTCGMSSRNSMPCWRCAGPVSGGRGAGPERTAGGHGGDQG